MDCSPPEQLEELEQEKRRVNEEINRLTQVDFEDQVVSAGHDAVVGCHVVRPTIT